MKLIFMISKHLRLLCCFAIMLFVGGCYSHFAINGSLQDGAVREYEISKVKLKDGTEINFKNNVNVLTSIESDSLKYLNNKGERLGVSVTDIVQWYTYKFDEEKTLFTALWIGISALLTLYFLYPGFSLGG